MPLPNHIYLTKFSFVCCGGGSVRRNGVKGELGGKENTDTRRWLRRALRALYVRWIKVWSSLNLTVLWRGFFFRGSISSSGQVSRKDERDTRQSGLSRYGFVHYGARKEDATCENVITHRRKDVFVFLYVCRVSRELRWLWTLLKIGLRKLCSSWRAFFSATQKPDDVLVDGWEIYLFLSGNNTIISKRRVGLAVWVREEIQFRLKRRWRYLEDDPLALIVLPKL